MVKRTQTIRQQIAEALFECVWPFCVIGAKRVNDGSQRFSEISVILRSLPWHILKSKTRNVSANSTQIQYKVDDSTIIKYLKTSEFFPHIKTKQGMTVHLSNKLETTLTKTNISYVLSTKTNAWQM